MEAERKSIRNLSVEEREEIFANVAKVLEGTAREAFAGGDGRYAALSSNMAEAILVHADELARDQLDAAERVLEQAAAMISQFRAVNPYPMVSTAVH
ncbi:hypothetical protein GOC91_18855 [Sinorhizobium medicae]|uniref:Uncharacterized protein n=1 Tax=Sinorhizobium medicae TaxID=110321 RepID=A0A508WSF3_9HYPH|nr:hypothetical protein [Sinorhizobium medicae]MBO1940134.1 hypothetical protein [Sinorhizobium medicae]MBO1962263.1 hypothetical protein [Sinorhizobium medicae]MDX0406470.1 hypothetical protein [Sinorhizobium medicae]MDX0412046.1 hypothetical protein [Sinorhizobium medicae]MDX0417995.1 hypothetical protein [Sinorhizobium medicae]